MIMADTNCLQLFQSTSSARRTTNAWKPTADSGLISIHVLREEDDLANENKDGTVF